VLDASLLQDNVYFMKTREAQCKYMDTKEIYHLLASRFDIIYFSARKLGFSRGGFILSSDPKWTQMMMEYVPLFEGFLTYGGLGAHLNCSEIVPNLPHNQYPAAAVGAALYIAGGIRGMERGTVSEQREPDGTERYAELELQRLAMPRRVFTLSQVKYCADRVKWMYDNREIIGGLRWVDEPKVLRFFFGRMKEIGHWQEDLVAKFREDFGDSL